MNQPTELSWTGERLVPSVTGDVVQEHLHRYALAADLAAGRDVLDIACGEGYGSHLLALRARTVVGVDLDAEVVAHARAKYTRTNLRFAEGSCMAIPMPAAAMDLVVSFETLEHFKEHEQFMAEVRRVLRPGGCLILSTPDRRIYTGRLGNRNQFHPRELDAEEFAALLQANFRHVALFGQRVARGSYLAPMPGGEASAAGTHRGDWAGIEFTPGVAEAVYLLAVCGDAPPPPLRTGLFEFGREGPDGFHPALHEAEEAAAALADLQAQLKAACDHWEYAQTRLRQQATELKQALDALAANATELASEREVCAAQVSALEEVRGQLGVAEDALAASRADLAATQTAHAATQMELGRARTLLAATRSQLAAAEQQQRATELRLGQTQARLEQAEAAVLSREHSLSWKLTKPLRSLAKRAAGARELARRGWVRLHPTSGSRRLQRAAKLLRRSGLFDARWYVQQYPAARHGRPDPVLHYLVHGAREGCDPNPLFDGDFYLRQNPDVAAAGMNPLVHYLHHGVAERRDPQAFFDTDWYLAQNPDVAAAGLNPLAHYLAHGAGEGRQPGPGFDGNAYLEANPDLRAAGVNPLAHYRWYGRAEGRRLRPALAPAACPLLALPTATVAPARTRQVVFLSGEPNTPGHDYRVRMYAKALTARGYAVEVVPLDQAGQGLPLPADVLVIWRAAWTGPVPACVAAARSHGAKVVFDVDDLMIDPDLARIELVDGIRSQGFTEPAIAEMYRQVQQTMLAADFCTCTTQPLASAMRRFQKTTFVLPNGFDEIRYQRSREAVAARRHQAGDGLIRIGYAGGSRTHQRDFGLATPAVARILREHPESRLVLFRLEGPAGHLECVAAHEFPDLAGFESQIEWRPFVPVQELPFELARFDINLAPLEPGNSFCEAKSELKYFEAALVDVPTVASPTQPYAAAMRHGQTGFLAGDDAAWYAALKRLVTEPDFRRQLGCAAGLDVLWRFGPERRAERAAAVFAQILDSESPLAAQQFELELRRAAAPRPAAPDCAPSEVVFAGGAGGWSEAAVVVPLHNYATHVIGALESVKAQTLGAKALVVVEDGSTDDSLRVADAWLRANAADFTQVALLKNRKNSGLARTRNAGFAFADAPFILALDADNLLEPQCLEKSLAALRRSGAAAAFGTIQEFGDGQGTRSAAPWQAGRFAGGNYVDAMALIRRSAWAAVGGYQPMSVMGWEDFDLWCRFVEEGLRGVWIPETLSRYRVHRQSMLQTRTEAAGNRRRLADEMRAQHPWVDAAALAGDGESAIPSAPELPPATGVPVPEATSFKPPAPPPAAAPPVTPPALLSAVPSPRPRDRCRLEELLPLLRCPETAQPLELVSAHELVTRDGRRQWPLVDWHPIFFGEAAATRRFPDGHLSNPVPDRALRLIEGLRGPALNMSAGGTRTWLPHCVELETAIFRNTDIVGDGHALPFADEVFDAVLAINAFEHYREPHRVVSEILRVLRPGGQVFIHTAFLQPLHEPPWHFFNCTQFGLLEWFKPFEVVDLCVSPNFNPIYALAWQGDELLNLLRAERGAAVAERFGALPLRDVAAFWSQPACQQDARWAELRKLSHGAQARLAAGFEFLGRKTKASPA